jgi:hypothetical protein
MYIDTVAGLRFKGRGVRIEVLMPALNTAGAAREAARVAYIAPDVITNKQGVKCGRCDAQTFVDRTAAVNVMKE